MLKALLLSLSLLSLPFQVKDALGTTFVFSHPLYRVASLSPAVTDMILEIGCGDRLVASTVYDEAPAVKVGGLLDPNLELLISLKPEVVFVMQPTPLRVIQTMKLRGLKVFALSEPSRLEDIAGQLLLLGRILGVADRAERAAQNFIIRLRAFPPRPTGPCVYIGGIRPPLWTGGRNTFLNELIERAGGRNCASSLKGWVLLSPERLLSLNPEIIVVPVGAEPEEQILSYMKGSFPWKHLRAVKEGRVFFIKENLLLRPSPRVLRALETLREILSGEKVSH